MSLLKNESAGCQSGSAFDKKRLLAGLTGPVQAGVFVELGDVRTIRQFLEMDLALSPDLLARIQTIMLDSRVVDDIDSLYLSPGSRLALSAAMPGVVGATLRRGGRYALMREGISCTPKDAGSVLSSMTACRTDNKTSFFVELRLYNTMIPALGAHLLRYGCLVRTDRVGATLMPFTSAPFSSCPTASDPAGRRGIPELIDLACDLRFIRIDI